MIKLHRHISANFFLNRHGRLGRQVNRRTVEVRTECSPAISHLYLLRQAKDLVATTVGQCWPCPAHEAGKPTGTIDCLLAGPQM